MDSKGSESMKNVSFNNSEEVAAHRQIYNDRKFEIRESKGLL